jgi:hypothetical protein
MHKAIDAIAYWQTVCITRPNGWGQHLDYTFSTASGPGVQSHDALRQYQKRHGKNAFDKSLSILFKK